MARLVMLILVSVFIAGPVSDSFAMCGMCGTGGEKAQAAQVQTGENVNNAICPMTGEAVDKENPVTYEYKGKIYNLCCPMCIDEFKKDPEKYVKIVEGQSAPEHAHSH